MIWGDAIFRKLFESYLIEIQSDLAMRAQAEQQRVVAELARNNMLSSAVGVARARLSCAGPTIIDFMQQAIKAFDRTREELGMDPDESDYDNLREYIESLLKARGSSVLSSLRSGTASGELPGLRVEETVTQLEGRARSELKNYVEREKLKLRSRVRRAAPQNREQIGELISTINRYANRAFGFSLFQLTEPKALLDLSPAPTTKTELIHRLQSLGVLLDQLNHREMKLALEGLGKHVPEGSINRLRELLQAKSGDVPIAALDRLRDLGRLRSGYPAHPLRPHIEDAAGRLGVSLADPEPCATWSLVMQRLIEAMTELATFFEALSPGRLKKTSL